MPTPTMNVLGPLEPELADLQTRVRAELGSVYDSDGYNAVLLTGSGTAAVEAMVGSLVPLGGRALVAVNGLYGERMAEMLALQGKAHDVVASPWGEALDLGELERRLRCGGYTHVLAVHHETTSGRLNAMAALGALCRRHGVPLLLDAVSSFGAEAIDLAGWNVEACAATGNKCMHGVPGVAFVLARREVFTARVTGSRSLYLDLFKLRHEQLRGSTPFTQAVQACRALDEALAQLAAEGGWRSRHAAYAGRMARLREGLAELGIEPFLADPGAFSAVVMAFKLPKGMSYAMLQTLLGDHGHEIYPGQGPLAGRLFRVAAMGGRTDAQIDELLAAFRQLPRQEAM